MKGELSELKLLVVEDETMVAMELECRLEDLGHQVLGVAASVPEAMALLQRFGDQAEGVILDANLAGASAAPIAGELVRQRIPFIVASGYTKEELAGLGFCGMSISKPYTTHELSMALRSMSSAGSS